MKIGYISDIHIDFYVKLTKEKMLKKFVASLNPQFYDVLIVAGDIGHYNHQNIALLRYFQEYTKHLIVTLGNHDLYLISDRMKKRYHRNSLQKVEELKRFCREEGIIYLDMEVVEIDGVHFGGGCLWYKVDEDNKEFWQEYMRDAKYIYLHHQEFYEQALAKFLHMPRCDIFISHIPQTKASEYLKPPFDEKYLPFYEQDNLALLHQKGVRYHIYGHNHTQGEFIKEGIHFLTCSIGYPDERLPKKIGSVTL